MTEIREVLRRTSPAPYPQGVALDDTTLWLTGCESHRVYAVDTATWTVRGETPAPGEPYGIAVLENELRVVIGFGDDADDRYIFRFEPHFGFNGDGIPCPDLSGAYVAFDGTRLFLSQAFNKKILELDDRGCVMHEIALERRPVGITIFNGCFYLPTTDDDFKNLQLTKVDARGETPIVTALASIPFAARGLAFDGSRFWTAHRKANEIVAFEAGT